MSRYDIARNLFAPKRRAYAALYNPAAVGYLGTGRLIKTVDFSAFGVGSTPVISANGGAVRIESLSAIVTVGAVSAGGGTMGLGSSGAGSTDICQALGVANFVLNYGLGKQASAAPNATNFNSGPNRDAAFGGNIGTAFYSPILLDSTIPNISAITAVIGVAVFTALSIRFTVIYTPITAGATLS